MLPEDQPEGRSEQHARAADIAEDHPALPPERDGDQETRERRHRQLQRNPVPVQLSHGGHHQ
jgi:hypothetical protein